MMLEAIGKYVGGRVLTALLVLATGAAGFWFWEHPEQLKTIWQVLQYVVAWIGFVLVLPWAGFFVTRWVVTLDSNTAAGLMLAGYLLVDVAAALWLAGGARGHAGLTWIVLLIGFLTAGVYNFMACEYQASRLEDV